MQNVSHLPRAHSNVAERIFTASFGLVQPAELASAPATKAERIS